MEEKEDICNTLNNNDKNEKKKKEKSANPGLYALGTWLPCGQFQA